MASSTATASSAHAVLFTTELLEMILLATPQRTILRLQGVNKYFKQTIKSSTSIDRKLFLKEDPSVSEACWVVDENQLITVVFTESVPASITTTVYAFNPLLLAPHWAGRSHVGLTAKLIPGRAAIQRTDLQNPAAAWYSQMFLTKPAATEMSLRVDWEENAPASTKTIRNATGVRVVDVLQEMQIVASNPSREILCCCLSVPGAWFATDNERKMVEKGTVSGLHWNDLGREKD